jgi:ribonuclease HI
VIVRDGAAEEIGGCEPRTTNNRMELRAALEALRRVPGEPVRLYTDSTYLLNGMTKWLRCWKRRGWLTAEGNPVESRELWEALEAVAGARVTWEHVRGHAGHPGNERANTIAQAYAAGRTPAPSRAAPVAPARVSASLPGGGTRAARGTGASYLSLVSGELRRHATWEECKAQVDRVSGARFRKCASAADEIATVAVWGLPADALARLDQG